jgi:hypothetical protein
MRVHDPVRRVFDHLRAQRSNHSVIEWCGKPVKNIRRGFVTARGAAGLDDNAADAYFRYLQQNAPKDTPQPILDKLAEALDLALDDETTRKRLFDLGNDVPGRASRGQAQLAALVKSEIARWTPIIKAAGK